MRKSIALGIFLAAFVAVVIASVTLLIALAVGLSGDCPTDLNSCGEFRRVVAIGILVAGFTGSIWSFVAIIRDFRKRA